jgi:hypothetical protein
MAAQEQQQGVVGLLCRAGLALVCRGLLTPSARQVRALRVDELSGCDGDKLGLRVGRNLPGPALICLEQRLLNRTCGARFRRISSFTR